MKLSNVVLLLTSATSIFAFEQILKDGIDVAETAAPYDGRDSGLGQEYPNEFGDGPNLGQEYGHDSDDDHGWGQERKRSGGRWPRRRRSHDYGGDQGRRRRKHEYGGGQRRYQGGGQRRYQGDQEFAGGKRRLDFFDYDRWH